TCLTSPTEAAGTQSEKLQRLRPRCIPNLGHLPVEPAREAAPSVARRLGIASFLMGPKGTLIIKGGGIARDVPSQAVGPLLSLHCPRQLSRPRHLLYDGQKRPGGRTSRAHHENGEKLPQEAAGVQDAVRGEPSKTLNENSREEIDAGHQEVDMCSFCPEMPRIRPAQHPRDRLRTARMVRVRGTSSTGVSATEIGQRRNLE
ncbi:MAG: hypothetical protein SGPRY_005461, partial [Prymnesium sp.]